MATVNRARTALTKAAARARQRGNGPARTTREALTTWARAHVPDRMLIALSIRAPYSHQGAGDGIRVAHSAGGLTVALHAVMQTMNPGPWIGAKQLAVGLAGAGANVTRSAPSSSRPAARPP